MQFALITHRNKEQSNENNIKKTAFYFINIYYFGAFITE